MSKEARLLLLMWVITWFERSNLHPPTVPADKMRTATEARSLPIWRPLDPPLDWMMNNDLPLQLFIRQEGEKTYTVQTVCWHKIRPRIKEKRRGQFKSSTLRKTSWIFQRSKLPTELEKKRKEKKGEAGRKSGTKWAGAGPIVYSKETFFSRPPNGCHIRPRLCVHIKDHPISLELFLFIDGDENG